MIVFEDDNMMLCCLSTLWFLFLSFPLHLHLFVLLVFFLCFFVVVGLMFLFLGSSACCGCGLFWEEFLTCGSFFSRNLYFLSSSLSFLFKDLCESAVWCEESESHSNQLPWCVWNFCIQHTHAGYGLRAVHFLSCPHHVLEAGWWAQTFSDWSSCHSTLVIFYLSKDMK